MRFPLKTVFIASLVTLTAFLSSVYFSCNRDKCKTIVCAHGGVCNEGSCICPSGYEGSNCETTSRDKFLGNWRVFEKGSITNAAQYPISIVPTTAITEVVIKNFYNYFRTNIKATIAGDTIYIPNQQYEGKVIFGVGYIYTNVTYGQYGAISMRYEVIDTATQAVNDFGIYPPDLSEPSNWNK
jgi:hypothetical protein